ncbi:Trigger factor [Seminavis robusta]|uniref:peptidylprolyl isomerase n=1 Tax=Seminavis robusta TaxID=568900 RepID=A0A9N8EAT2_9STRA|nr:Trigger factor [Seminavis robusta]|eukprot:Sro897_g217510.1 Trigger factor (544) ;mRNA; r:32843-34598
MKFPTRAVSLLWLVSTSTTSTAFVPHATSRFGVSTRLFQSSSAGTESSIKHLPESAVELTVTAPGKATKAAYDKACSEISQNIEIPGFRKGSKIPAQILEQAIRQNSADGQQGGKHPLKAQAITALINQLVEPTLKEHQLDPIGQPSMVVPVEEMVESFQPGEDLTIQVKCDVWPEIVWKESDTPDKAVYKGLKGSYSRKPFDQAKMDKALDDLKERYASLEKITDDSHTLQMGDACTVNMEGFMANPDGTKGEPLPNAASGDRVEVVLGEGRYMEGLVEGLIGAKVDDTVQVSVAFPDKLRDKTLAGKQAIFDVTVLEASKRTVPELTDEFAAKVKAGLTAESLQAELRKAVDEEDAKEFRGARNAALSKALAETVEVDIPDTLVTNQAREKFALMMTEMRDNGVSDEEIKNQIKPENFLKYKDIVKGDIIRDFRVSMATDEIARIEGIEVPDYQVEEQLEAIRKDAAQEGEEIDDNSIRGKVEATLQRQAVMDFLADNADLDVQYKEEEFDAQLMEKLAEESLARLEKEKESSAVDAEIVE